MADNPSAFPEIHTTFYEDGEELKHPRIQSYGGMELRDWFASQAMIGILSRYQDIGTPILTDHAATKAADFAYVIADAMMVRRRDQDSNG